MVENSPDLWWHCAACGMEGRAAEGYFPSGDAVLEFHQKTCMQTILGRVLLRLEAIERRLGSG